VRALANNEFLTSRYDELTDDGERTGHMYLNSVDMKIGKEWIGYGALYLFGFGCMCLVLHSLLLRRPYFESSKGTTRVEDEPEMLDNEDDKAIQAENEAHADDPGLGSPMPEEEPLPKSLSELPRALSAGSMVKAESSLGGSTLKTLREALPFSPTWLTFSDIVYTVKVPGPNGSELIDRPLLRGVSGYAEPGKLTALMGASGAGKTTLLDVLAGRKNMGVIEGKILLNGRVPTPTDFARVTGYVEQFDSLLSYDTVRETLAFAAHLRLPSNVAYEIKERIVDEVLEILDLTNISNSIIGSKKIPGLSPSQLKRVNIGCELVANPSVLFLDEPTTGLDSRAAQTVMRVVRRIARSGRSVICTIHQPSAELFFLFDRLVLLASGGHQMFFGDLGTRSKRFVKYLESVPKVTPIRPRINPASWMLEELGVGVSDSKSDAEPTAVIVERAKTHYINSKVLAHAMTKIRAIEALAEGGDGASHTASVAPEVPPQALEMPPDAMLIEVGGAAAPTMDMSGAGMQRRSSFSVNSHATHVSAALPTALTAIPDHTAPTLSAQLHIVMLRTWRSYWRNPPMLMSRFKVMVVLSIVFGCIYFDLSISTQSAATSFIAALTVAATFGAVTHATNSLPGKIDDRVVFYRETSSGMYAPLLWPMAGLLCDIVWCAPGALLLQIPMYFMIGLLNEASAFFKYFFAVYLFCVLFTSMSMMMAAISPNSASANGLMGIVLSVFFTFGGVSITLPKVPQGYKWLFRLLPASHITEALAMPQFVTCSPMPDCTPLIEVVENATTRLEPIGVFVANYIGFTFDGYWNAMGWVTLFMLGIWIISFVATQKLRFDKR
jgi:ABC-type multidrug transport system ATPase subunit/ABC-type multidrug transport system permease subunit